MSNDKEIYGGVVALGLPKPDLMQTDPKKGDFVFGKDVIPAKVSQLENDANYLDESVLPEAIDQALDALPRAVNIPFEKLGNTISAGMLMDDGTTRNTYITLDDNGYPTKVTMDGAECTISWRGFDE